METINELKASYRLTYLERLRAAWDLTVGSPVTMLWLCICPGMGALLLWVMSWPESHNTGWDYFFVVACFAFVPFMFAWSTLRAHHADRGKGLYNYRFNGDGIHVTTETSELTHRWPKIRRVRKTRNMLYLYFTKRCAHCVPLRVLPSHDAPEIIGQLAKMGGVHRVGT